MTNKEKILKALSSFPYPVSYRYSDLNELPRFSYSLMSNFTRRLSNKRHTQQTIYQIDYFCEQPIDVEGDNILTQVIEALEDQGLNTTDWIEAEQIDTDQSFSLYHYFIEVN